MTIKDFYNQIFAEKNNFSELEGLTEGTTSDAATAADRFLNDVQSQSKVADWRLWIWVAAFTSWFLNKLFENFKTETREVAARKYAGSVPYYLEKMLAYQDGDSVEYINDTPTYAVKDESKQIIKYVSVSDGPGAVAVKVAKEGPVPLETDEFNRANAFLAKIKPPGINTNLVSAVADRIKYDVSIYFDPMRDENTVKTDVESAITSYFDTIPSQYFNTLNSSGVIIQSKFVDAIQAADGVVDVQVTALEHATGTGSYEVVDRIAGTYAGYVDVKHDLSNLNMVPNEL